MTLLERRLLELRDSVALAADVSVAPKSIPDWWKKLSDNGRSNYLIQHPKSRYRNIEVTNELHKLNTQQRDELGRFLTKLTGPKGMLTKAAEKRITPEAIAKIPAKDKEKIADLLRASHGDMDAAARVAGEGNRLDKVRDPKVSDYFEKDRKPKNKMAQRVADDLEKKLGRAATYNELKKGLKDALDTQKPSGGMPGAKPPAKGLPTDPITEKEKKWWNNKSLDDQDAYLDQYPKSRFRTLREGFDNNDAPVKRTEGTEPNVNPASRGGKAPEPTLDGKPRPAPEPVDPNAKPAKPGGKAAPKTEAQRQAERKAQKDAGYRAVALTLAALGLMVVGGAALVGAGVPISIFTPELVKFVWKDLPESLSGKKNDELVSGLATAIKSKFAAGSDNKDLEAAMIAKSSGHNDNNPAAPLSGPTMPLRARPFRKAPDKVKKPWSPARATWSRPPKNR